jgi:hypothetical protein
MCSGLAVTVPPQISLLSQKYSFENYDFAFERLEFRQTVAGHDALGRHDGGCAGSGWFLDCRRIRVFLAGQPALESRPRKSAPQLPTSQ